MKVIISRKGFDSQNGGVPSAILPDGRLVPFPIPSLNDPSAFGNVMVNGVAVGELVEALTRSKFSRADKCHLDPDLDKGSLPRLSGWHASFGQIDAAQGHLSKQGICTGDLFLFFGWFREVEDSSGGWRYLRGSQGVHVIYGWLRVGEVIRLGLGERPSPIDAFSDHPHLHGRERASNTLYVATDRLGVAGIDAAGAGLFPRIADSLILTCQSQRNRSVWRLPGWMHPARGSSLSYHLDRDRWRLDGDHCGLQSVAKGQEFVLRAEPVAVAGWLSDLFTA